MSSTELNQAKKGHNVKSDWWNELSDKQKKQIQLGVTDANNRKLFSSKEFWNKLKASHFR